MLCRENNKAIDKITLIVHHPQQVVQKGCRAFTSRAGNNARNKGIFMDGRQVVDFCTRILDALEMLQESFNRLEESFDGLRLRVKYLEFDLEATKRENKHLRRLLAQVNGEDED